MSYQLITLTSNISLSWLEVFEAPPFLLDINDVSASSANLFISLPNALDASLGSIAKFNNVGNLNFSLHNFNQDTQLYNIAPGEFVTIYLDDNSTSNGSWRVVSGAEKNGVVAFSVTSSDSSVLVSGGNISPPGGTIDLKLPSFLSDIQTNITETGFATISSLSPFSWASRHLVAGENINISNPNGVAGDPVISLGNSISSVASIEVGEMTITGSVIDANLTNGGLSFSSNGTGLISLNGVTFDVNTNVAGINNLTLTGRFTSPYTPCAWGVMTDTLISSGNEVTLASNAGISSVSGMNGVYTFSFKFPITNTNYAVIITPFSNDSNLPLVTHAYPILRTLTSFTIVVVDAGGEKVASVPNGLSVLVMSA